MPSIRRVLCLCLCLFALLSACDFRGWLFDEHEDASLGDAAPPSPSASPAIPSGPATIDLYGLAWDPVDILDPLRDESAANHVFYPLVYEGLFSLDASFTPQPALCTHTSVEDNRIFTFTLRANVTFHDGTPLTVADVAASFTQARATGSPYATQLAGVRAVEADEALRQITVTLDAPNARFPALCTFPIVQVHNPEIGTGPYRLNRTGESPALTWYDGWWQKKQVPLRHWELVAAQTPDQILSEFENGAVTVVPLDPSGEGPLWAQGTYESFSYATARMVYVGFNAQMAPLNQPEVRRAIARYMDRDAWIQAFWPGMADPVFWPVPPDAAFARHVAAKEPVLDAESAAAMLAEAGWMDCDGDGRIDTSGRYPIPVSLRLLVARDKPLRVSLAGALAQSLEQLGFTVEVVPLAPKAFLTELTAGHFDLYVGEAELAADFNPAVFLEGGALGYGCARNPELSELLAEAQAAAPDQSAAAWTAFWQQWQTEAVMLPLFFRRMELAAVRGSLRNPTPVWGNLFYRIEEWS